MIERGSAGIVVRYLRSIDERLRHIERDIADLTIIKNRMTALEAQMTIIAMVASKRGETKP
jgi:hypothetical protein